MTGCSGNADGGDPNYSTKVDLTPEQKAKIEQDKANRPPPGTVGGMSAGPQAEPKSGMKPPPGKGH